MERLRQMGPWDAVLPVHGFLAQVDLPLDARDLIFAARQPAPRPKTAHPAALGPDKINQYFDAMLKVAREKLAVEQARPTSSR